MDSMTVTAREYAYLAACCGAEQLWGLPSPFAGLEGSRLTGAMAQAAASLAGKGLMKLSFDGEVSFPEETLRLVGCCARPDRRVSLSLPGAKRVSFFERSGLWTKRTQDGETIRLETAEPDGALSCFLGSLPLPQEAPLDALVASRDELAAIAESAGKPERCLRLLCERGVSEGAARQFAEILRGPCAAASLTLLDHQLREGRGVAVAAGEPGALALAPDAGGVRLFLAGASRLREVCAPWFGISGREATA